MSQKVALPALWCFACPPRRVRNLKRLWLTVPMLLAFALLQSASASDAKVTVDLKTVVNILTNSSVGLPASPSDSEAFDPTSARYTRLAGVNILRYPGAPNVADLYHWSSKSLTRIAGEVQQPYISPNSDFGTFARNLDGFGTALIVVNYGSNAKGTGGGDPSEAAAWVAYANGDSADNRPIPQSKDSQNWHTVGFWATLRGQAPLPTDDGLNFLRISHPRPFAIHLWQIGDQVYDNGYYGNAHSGRVDLHSGSASAGSREKNLELGPSSYGSRVVEFARTMKAIDPTIRIGAALATPDGQPTDSDWSSKQWTLDWNQKVLKAGCSAIDFISLDWQPVSLLPPDWKTLNEADLLNSSRGKVGSILNSLLRLYSEDCPKDHLPRIAFSTASVPTWPKLDHPTFDSLWVADTYSVLIETGSEDVTWPEMHGPTMISGDGKAFGPAFRGLEMLHIAAYRPGDAFVKATSSNPLVAVHATRRRDGLIGLMVINEDPSSPATVRVNIEGAGIAPAGRRIDYGRLQQVSGSGPAVSPIKDLGPKFTIVVPAYTITDILVPLAK